MSFDASQVEIPETYARNSLAGCQTWRGIVANPLMAWEDLQALIIAGGIAEGDAATQIELGAMNDNPEFGTVLEPPRACIRKFDDDTYERLATSGFSLTGGLTLTFELPVPTGAARYNAATRYADVRRKMECLAMELRSLPRTAGYLDLLNVATGPIADGDPKSNENEFVWAEINLQFGGGDG